MKRLHILLGLIIAIHLLLLFSLRFTAWPEMFTYAYLRNNGFLLYKDMVHPYPPVLTIILSILYKFLGYNLFVLQSFTWFLIIVNDLVIYLVVRAKIKSQVLPLLAVAAYVILQPFMEGNMLWFDIAITTPLLMGLLFIETNIFISVFFIVSAALTKQTGGLFYLAFLLWIFLVNRSKKKIMIVIAWPTFVLFVLGIRLYFEGAIDGFLDWVIFYPLKYWSNFPGYVRMDIPFSSLFQIALVFAPLLILVIKNIKRVLSRDNLLLLFFVITGTLSIYPRFSFFHFQTVLPFVVILTAVLLPKSIYKKSLLVGCYLALLLLTISIPSLKREFLRPPRFMEKLDLELATKVMEYVKLEDTLFLYNLPSHWYVLGNLLPPKPWADNFGWYYEVPGFQGHVISGWEKFPPQVIIAKDSVEGNWFEIGSYQPKEIMSWISKHYHIENSVSEGITIWRKDN